jgi:hypothetical protein
MAIDNWQLVYEVFMMKNLKYLLLTFAIGWLVILSACSYQPDTILDQQLANITEIVEWPKSTISERLSPNAEWYLNYIPDSINNSEFSCQVISTKDPSVTLDQRENYGYNLFPEESWAPDSSAFVAVGYESPGRCYENKILIISLHDDELTTAIYDLPVKDCLSIEWSSDSEYLVVYQTNTFYVLDKKGQLQQEFIYEKSDNVGMSFLMNEEGIMIFQDSEDKSELIIKSVDLSNPENPETINVFGYETDTVVFLEEDNNRVWLYDSVDNTLSPTNITVSGEVFKIDIVGKENKIAVMFEEDDSLYLNIYDLTTEQIEESISIYNYIGWYPDLGGFLFWTGTVEDGMFEIVN